MHKFLRTLKTLTVASMRMYFRNRGAVVFTLIVPLALLGVFGFLSRSSNASVKVDITNYSQTELSRQFVDALKGVSALQIKEVPEGESSGQLGKGNIDLQVIIPDNFGKRADDGSFENSIVATRYNQGKPQNGQIGNLIISQVTQSFNSRLSGAPQTLSVDSQGVKTNNLGFFDFILPGILGMIIMQSGVFGVAFAFVSFKASGALRRIQATPVHPRNFIVGQAITRLIMTLVTVAILIGFGAKFFGFHMLGSYFDLTLVVILGSLIFLGFGFAIAGYSKDENQVAPLANVVQLPMLLLSGIFFPRDAFPAWLKTVTDYFPLTYLTDAMRHIANEGMRLSQLGHDLLGLGVWTVVIFLVAMNLFRWE